VALRATKAMIYTNINSSASQKLYKSKTLVPVGTITISDLRMYMCCAVPNAEEEKRQEVATSDPSFLFLEKKSSYII
jgi:hypothetical protein